MFWLILCLLNGGDGLSATPATAVGTVRPQRQQLALDVYEPRRTKGASLPNPVQGPFVDDDEMILASAKHRTRDEESRCAAYLRAGPRSTISLDPRHATCAVVTCGGLCPGLNAVVQEVGRCLREQYGVERVLGVRGGYAGIVHGHFEELDLSFDCYARGGTVLGTSRGKRCPETMATRLRDAGVDCLFVVGGDGTMRGASALCKEIGDAVRVVAIPKTIDNDIPLVDRSFGFDTAVAAAKQAIDVAVVEARSFPRGLGIVRLMGRDAGFLAAHAAMAAPGSIDAVLVPEKSFALDPLMDYLEARLDAHDAAVLVVAEGVNARLSAAEDDSSEPLRDVGAWLCDKAKERIRDISLKYVDPGYGLRAIPSNAADTILCSRLATNAVHAALAGFTDCAVATLNGKYALVPLDHLATQTNIVAVRGHLWGDLQRSTGQPDFSSPSSGLDSECDDADLEESLSGGCVVSYD